MNTAHRVPQRAVWVDVARVVATLGIVLCHVHVSRIPLSAQPDCVAVGKEILAFPGSLLAFFFVISGYFCKPDMPWEKWVKRIAMLMAGYVVWNLLYAPGYGDRCTFQQIFGVGLEGARPADYPLWYVWALMMLMFVMPLFRRCIWLYFVIALAGTVWGNSWHCAWLGIITFPLPFYAMMYAMGSMFSYVSLPKMQRCFQYAAPVWAVLCAAAYWARIPIPFLHEIASAFLLLSASALLALLPKISHFISKLADASYLCYAAHAGLLIVFSWWLERFLPESRNSGWVYCLLPIATYAASVIALRLMRAYAPWLLPWLAHAGKLPFLK